MKTVMMLSILLFIFNANVSFAAKSFKSLQGNRYGFCVQADDGVICRGQIGVNSPAFSSPVVSYSANADGGCALTQNSIECWGDSTPFPLAAKSQLKGPREILSFGRFSCILDDEGFLCWGGASDRTFEPHRLYLGGRNVYDSISGVTLGGSHLLAFVRNSMPVPKTELILLNSRPNSLSYPSIDITGFDQKIFAGDESFCLQGTSGIKCYYMDYNGFVVRVRPDNDLTALVASAKSLAFNVFGGLCAITKTDDIKCWSKRTSPNYPERPTSHKFVDRDSLPAEFLSKIKNPKEISQSNDSGTVCVTSDIGVQCWYDENYKPAGYYEVLAQ